MCCFSQPVESVTNTRIFARLVGDKQALVYQMRFQSHSENAMILPLPVRQGAGDKAVSFVSLKGYSGFFSDLNRAFPSRDTLWGAPRGFGNAVRGAPLVVHEVGDFIASYVPSINDFSRLNPRFAIPKESWNQIGGYEDYGFAVFQLKTRSGETHPMAFTFESRYQEKLFFPTVHIHDGKVHAREDFDHSLFYQDTYDTAAPNGEHTGQAMSYLFGTFTGRPQWVSSMQNAQAYCNMKAARGLVHPDRRLYRLRLIGSFENQDVIVEATSKLGSYRGSQGPSVQNGSMATGVFAGFAWLMKRRIELADRRDAKSFGEHE